MRIKFVHLSLLVRKVFVTEFDLSLCLPCNYVINAISAPHTDEQKLEVINAEMAIAKQR